ncbi:caf1 family ribonuclease [Phlyctema vagabunda]|uniref:Poly(A)-specific ribonuclease PARN n=1 Tax=Phlyctema vagabunda TaxID=108571 RepID=A0ABR4PNV7_9HELO
MEVDRKLYPKQLLSILNRIANASFISFDLEMSGISTKARHGMDKGSRDAGKPSLQQQYSETKEAAETFQVLQVGITVVEEDREKGMYIARPYNFHLSPLFLHGDRLNIDRKFGFSSSACDFLLKNHFDFGQVFNSGVPYLSREEEKYAREQYQIINGLNKRDDIVISLSEPQTLDFYRNARKTITAWLDDKSDSRQSYVNISNPDGPLNGYQRRLIHQLVQNEFPDYRTFARHEKSFMQVEKTDKLREAEIQRRKLTEFNSMVAKQVGLRWIIEALCGGDLTSIDPWWFRDEAVENGNDMLARQALEKEFRQVAKALKEKEHVLVGHNLFTDLIFLYKTFIGELPSEVRDFQKKMHHLFPIVIDTKYLATYDADAMNPREGLKQLWEPFTLIHKPLVSLGEQHMSYGAVFGKDHEAGFDSWMTAELFVKLAAKIYSEQTDPELSPAGSDSEDDESDEDYNGSQDRNTEHTGGVRLNAPDTNDTDDSASDNALPAWHAALENNPFMALVMESEQAKRSAGGTEEIEQWLPDLDSWFWRIYSNKLRVNSVEGGVCHLSLVDIQ